MISLLYHHQPYEDPQNKILAAALHLYTGKGFRETSVLEVVERARVSKTTFYHFFNSKEDLLIQLFQSLLEEVLKEVKQTAALETHIAHKSFAGIRRYLQICNDHRPVARLLLVSSSGLSPEVEEVRHKAHVEFATFIYESVRAEPNQMKRLSDDQIHTAAQAMVGAINEVVIHKIIVEDKKDIEELAQLLNRIAVGTFTMLAEFKGGMRL
ncbi:TetR/AcrR family transcriptional regulator [Salicibibacter halophilus]|uniref:TetR/AcrR family transcriptional regulator n=1 Tax=Salicibibacter halophilus TaxID=2502791 RepID=A0A514LJP4_9BACI|nr:TetR/AcrR family transcriptional regulator [Salicibibacter halophilus]QDI92042.1 TetR/AcrR family transcriptional regulator [Salicibibacter halophilus]